MTTGLVTERCADRRCRAELVWVHSAATGKRFPLNADPVPPRTQGALVLIGGVAFSLSGAVARLADMFGCADDAAWNKAMTEYGWHLPHPATCAGRQQHARRSR